MSEVRQPNLFHTKSHKDGEKVAWYFCQRYVSRVSSAGLRRRLYSQSDHVYVTGLRIVNAIFARILFHVEDIDVNHRSHRNKFNFSPFHYFICISILFISYRSTTCYIYRVCTRVLFPLYSSFIRVLYLSNRRGYLRFAEGTSNVEDLRCDRS